MDARRITLGISTVVFLVSLGLLVTGSPALLWSLMPGLPLGTISTWAGMVALPLMMRSGLPALREPETRMHRAYAALFLALVGLGASWGLMGFALSGNWANTFTSAAPGFRGSAAASPYFWQFTYLCVGLPLLTLAIYGLHSLALRLFTSRS